MGNSDAKTVSSSKLIWLTETPNKAGTMSTMIRLTPSCRGAQRGRGTRPMPASAGT